MPVMRKGVVPVGEHVARVIEAHRWEDQGHHPPDPHGPPRLGHSRYRRRQHQNGPVLGGLMPGRGGGMVGGIEAFRPFLVR